MKGVPPITEPDVVKALAHPLRVRILNILDQRTASPVEIARELDVPLGNVSYHVRTLARLRLIKIVGRRQRRGAIEHFYRADERPVITDRAWGEVPEIAKHALVQASLSTTSAYIEAAAQNGGFNRTEAHLSRQTLEVDAATFKAISEEIADVMLRVRKRVAEASERMADEDGEERKPATVVLMLFEGGEPTKAGAADGDAHKPARKAPKRRAAAAAR